MNFIEILTLAKEGKKIRNTNWHYSEFIYYTREDWYNKHRSRAIMPKIEEFTTSWEIYQEQLKTYTFQEVLRAFNEGTNIKRSGQTYWSNRKDTYENEEIFTLDDVNANDWIIEVL